MGLFSKDIKTLDDLFIHGLRDIYYAENQIVDALPDIRLRDGDGCDRTGHGTTQRAYAKPADAVAGNPPCT